MNEQNKFRPKNLFRVLAILAVFLSAFSAGRTQPTNYCQPNQGPSTWPTTYLYCWPMYYVQYGYYPYYGSILKEVNILQGSSYLLSSITSPYTSGSPYQGGPSYDDPSCFKFYESPQPSLYIGETYKFQLKIAHIYGFMSYYCSSTYYTQRIFIDWNQDGDFKDQNPDEWINHPGGQYATPSWRGIHSSWGPSCPNINTYEYNIKIPDNIDPGKTRMRVMTAYYSPYYGDYPLPNPPFLYGYYNTYGADACHNGYMYDFTQPPYNYGYGELDSYGETEDYVLDLSLPLKSTFPDNIAPNDILYANELYNGTTRTRYTNEGDPYQYYYEKPYVEFFGIQPSGSSIKYSIQGPLPSTTTVYTALNPSGGEYIDISDLDKYVINKATGIYAPNGNGDFKSPKGGEYNLIITMKKPNGLEKAILKRFNVSWPNDLAVSEVISPEKSGPPRYYQFPPRVPVAVSAVYQNVGLNNITKFEAYADIYKADGTLYGTLHRTFDTTGGFYTPLTAKSKVTIDFGTFTSEDLGEFTIVFRGELKSASDDDMYNNRLSREGESPYTFIIQAPVEIQALRMDVPSDGGTLYSGRAFIPQGTVINNGVEDVSNVVITFKYRQVGQSQWQQVPDTILPDVPKGRYNTSVARWAGTIIDVPGEYEGFFQVKAVGDYVASNDTISFHFTVIGGLSGVIRVGAGQTYSTINLFMDDLYKRGLSGDLTVEFTDNVYDITAPFEDAPAWDLSSYIIGLGQYKGQLRHLTFKPSVERSKERGSIEFRMHSYRGDGVRFGQNMKPTNPEAPVYYSPTVEYTRTFANTPGYITFDGGANKSMKFILYSGSQIQGRAFSLQRGSHHITLKNLLIENASPAISDDYEIPRMQYIPSEGFTYRPDSLILVDKRLGYSAGIASRATLTDVIHEYKIIHVDTVQNSNNTFSNNEIKGFGYGIVNIGIGPLINPRTLSYQRFYNLNNTIDGNLIYDVERSGIFLGFEEGTNVKQNRIYNTRASKSDKAFGIEMGFETATYGFGYNNVGVILDGNEISDISASKTAAGISVFQDGQLYPTVQGGLAFFPNANENFKMFNNIIVRIGNTAETGDRFGIVTMTNRNTNLFNAKYQTQTIKGTLVSNNTIYLENDNIINKGNQAAIGLFNVTGGRIYNNAIAISDVGIDKSSSLFDAAVVYYGIYPSDAGLHSDNNVYWIADKSNWSTYRFYQLGGTTLTTNYVYPGYENEFRDLEQWQMWTHEDMNSIADVDFRGDYSTTVNLPKYMRIKSSPYPLGSILSNRGKNLSDYTWDLTGKVRGDGGFAYDIGACEFNGRAYLRDLETDLIVAPGNYSETAPNKYSEGEYVMTEAPVEVVTRIFNGGSSLVVNGSIGVQVEVQTEDGSWQPFLASSANIERIEPFARLDLSMNLADGIGDEFVPKTYYELNQEGFNYTIPAEFESMKENVTPLYRIRVKLGDDLYNQNNEIDKVVRFYVVKAGYKMLVSSPSDLSPMPASPSVNDIAGRLNYTALQSGLVAIGMEKDPANDRFDYDYFNRSGWEPRAVDYTAYRTIFWNDGDAENAPESYMYTPGQLNSLINYLDAGTSNAKKNIIVASQELVRMHNETDVEDLLSSYLRASDKTPSNPMGQGVSYDQLQVKGVAIARGLTETIQKTGYSGDQDPMAGLFNIVPGSTGYSQIGYIYNSLGSYANPGAPNSERIMSVVTSTLGYNSVIMGLDWRHFANLDNVMRATVDYLNEFGGMIVPIELLSFDAQPVGNRVEVRWTTGSEKGSSYFEVEKREIQNGISSEYKSIEKVNASGETIDEVHYGPVYDRAVKFGGEYVYRLRMVDKDGSMKYSDEKTVKIASGNGDLWMSEVLPNPVQSELKVRVNVGENSAEMIIYDLNGRELKHLAVSNNGIEQEIRIDVSNMVPGTYTLAMKSGEKVTITRQFTIVR